MTDIMKGKQFYGAVAVGERGQIVIPVEARNNFGIKAGDKLVVIGSDNRGIILLKADKLKEFAEKILKSL
jgi:AbrB family looped-hinge helix DNA binding protein